MNSKNSKLGKRLFKLLIQPMCVVSFLLLAGGAYVYSRDMDQVYKDKVSGTALSLADAVDGDYIAELKDAIDSQEFADVLSTAGLDDDTPISDWLKEKGLREEYDNICKLVEDVTKDMDVAYLYIQTIDENGATYLVEPSAGYYALGYKEEIPKEYGNLTSNGRVEAAVSRTESGWFSSGGEPVMDSAGNKVAIVCVDIDMNEIVRTRIQFIIAMLIEFLIVAIIATFVYRSELNKSVIAPIKLLTESAEKFGTGEEGFDKDNIMELDIRSGDEIEDMYHELHFMQESIIDYMNNLEAVTAERERIGAELSLATKIQADMLPNIFPAFPDREEFDIYASMTPAKEVGGDFYDFFLVDDDHLAIVIADVSGKGVPAALFMMMSKILINNVTMMEGADASPAKVLTSVNDIICQNNEEEMFVTVWLGIMTISTGHVVAANAGHEYPILKKADGSFELFKDKHGFVIGGMEGMKYKEYDFTIDREGALFLYTGGVAEATNGDNELFGIERTLDALNKNDVTGNNTPKDMLNSVKEAVDAFVGDAPQFDDLTMLAVKLK